MIRDLHAQLVEKKLSARELTDQYLHAIGRFDPQVNAYLHVTADRAQAQADVIDARIAQGETLGILEGIPYSLKDIISTKGVVSTGASKILEGYVPPFSATVANRLETSGAILIGKVNNDEFAMGGSTEHSAYHVTHNPWDLSRVPGGSSGGSSASIASETSVFSIGTDTGGSIRQPAALCGISGLKVTYGRVSRFGVMSMASSWDTIGPMAHSVDDLAIVLEQIAGYDGFDATCPKQDVPAYAQYDAPDIKKLRIGIPKEYFSDDIDPEVRATTLEAIRFFEKEGATIKDVSLPTTRYGVALYYISVPAEVSANMSRYDGIRFGPSVKAETIEALYQENRGKGFGDEVKRRIMIGTYVLSHGYYDAYYKKAHKVRTLVIEDFARVFDDVDVIMGPVSPDVAYPIGSQVSDPLAMYMADVLTIPASTAGLPALSIPCGFKDNMPMGLQIIGRAWSEKQLCDLGRWYQGATDWHARKPAMLLS